MKDHPGDYLTKCGYDIYLNPWWGANTARSQQLILKLNTTLGPPDLWYQGLLHELLWGPRDLHIMWRPSFTVNLSGPTGQIWRHFWLPWRARGLQDDGKSPSGANTPDLQTTQQDIDAVEKYKESIPKIRIWLQTGDISLIEG